MNNYFYDTTPPRAVNGSPIFQYLYALDLCGTPYALHLEPDVLLSNGQAWLNDALEFLHVRQEAVFATPGSPPLAENAVEAFLGFPLKLRTGWKRNADVTTRYFLCHLDRLRDTVPWVPQHYGEALEKTLHNTFQHHGLESWCRHGDESWALHVMYHDESFLRLATELIAAVEAGCYPFVRTGEPWDLRTDGRHLKPWLKVIKSNPLFAKRRNSWGHLT